MAEHTSGVLNIQGAPLYYEVAGEGHPLLLIHAGIADSSMWDDQFPLFAQHYRTIRYDLRGYGQSRFPNGPFANHEDPTALLNALDAQKAHIVGISFGSKIALDFALTHPERVASLILVAPSVGGTKPSKRMLTFFQEEEALLEKGDLEAATELNLRLWVDGLSRTPDQVIPQLRYPTLDQVNPTVRQRVHDMQYHAFTIPEPEGAHDEAPQSPALTRLAEVRVPTLIIVGDLDLPEVLGICAHLASDIPGARLEFIIGAAHMVSMEKPEEFNRIALDFLSEL